ncbi:MAG: hypothetical protein HGB35_06520 [Geobacteraceae bacterium]|nr:hypothetical protein [Geobacteraceae bacterium]
MREKLMVQALKLAGVSKVYRADSQRFVEAYICWLEEAEKDLSGLRSPISILLQAEKSSLTSVLDGYQPDFVQQGKSIRKYQKALAAHSLEKISREIYSKIETIDQAIDQLNEKFCHAIAVLRTKEPELYKNLQTNQDSVDRIWKMLAATQETLPMYNYFCAKLSSTDIHYLLMDIIQNISSNKTE